MGTLGKAVRLARLRNAASGRIFTVAIDHAPSYGVLPGLEDIAATTAAVAAGGPDALLMMKGTAERLLRALRRQAGAHPQELDALALTTRSATCGSATSRTPWRWGPTPSPWR